MKELKNMQKLDELKNPASLLYFLELASKGMKKSCSMSSSSES